MDIFGKKEIKILKNLNKDLADMVDVYRSRYQSIESNFHRFVEIMKENNFIIDTGESFEIVEQNPIFSQEEIKRLIILCHPDKHGGKKMAVDLTEKLIKMRNK